jgi:transcriptional accessory protein Tex/SPT6
VAEQLLQSCGISKEQLAKEVSSGRLWQADEARGHESEAIAKLAASSEPPQSDSLPAAREDWDRCFRTLEFQKLGEVLHITREHARRLVNELRFAGRDVREISRLPIVRHGSLKAESLQPGELLPGRVVNTTSFGAFVEVAPGIVGLIHVSRLGDGFVQDPREVLMEGESIPVWVLSVDRERNRLALSLSPPGAPRPARSGPPPAKRPPPPPKSAAPAHGEKPRASTTPRGGQPPRPRKPKQVVPLTEGMKSGREPMRTFGDLKQFFEIKTAPQAKPPLKKPDGGGAGKNDST